MSSRFLIIIPSAVKGSANTVAKAQLDLKRGERTFSIGLSATGKPPVTHYWCSSVISDEVKEKVVALPDLVPSADIRAYDANNDPKFPGLLLASLGLKQIVNFPEKPWR